MPQQVSRTSTVRVGRRLVWLMLSQYLGVSRRSSFFWVTIMGPSPATAACAQQEGRRELASWQQEAGGGDKRQHLARYGSSAPQRPARCIALAC